MDHTLKAKVLIALNSGAPVQNKSFSVGIFLFSPQSPCTQITARIARGYYTSLISRVHLNYETMVAIAILKWQIFPERFLLNIFGIGLRLKMHLVNYRWYWEAKKAKQKYRYFFSNFLFCARDAWNILAVRAIRQRIAYHLVRKFQQVT